MNLQHRFVLSALIASLTIGCTTSPSTTAVAHAPQPPDPGPFAGVDSVQRELSPLPGRFSHVTLPLADQAASGNLMFEVRLRIAEVKPDSKWGPQVGACVEGEKRRPAACVHLGKFVDADALYATGSYMPEGGPPFERAQLSDDLEVSHVHRVIVKVNGRTVRLELADGTHFERTMQSRPKFLALSCSTARCEVSTAPIK